MARYLSLKFATADGATIGVSIPYCKSVLTETDVRTAAAAMIAASPWVTAPTELRSASIRETNVSDIVRG